MANGEIEGSPYKIQTFVFLDLETLSFYDDRPRILELAMIAVSRDDLLSMKREAHKNNPIYKKGDPLPLPRVCPKYTMLYYPRKIIFPRVEEITGLSNYNLHHLKGFNKDRATSIKQFLDFPPPVAFVAHNGNDFDFPILKAELMGVHEENLEGVVCIDSLRFSRQFEEEDIRKLTEIAKEFLKEDDDFTNNNNNNCDTPDNCRIIGNGINGHSPLKNEEIEAVPSSSTHTDIVDNYAHNNYHTSEKLKIEDIPKTNNLEASQKRSEMDNCSQFTNLETPPKKRKNESSMAPPPHRGKNDLPSLAPYTPSPKRPENANVHNDFRSQARKALFQSDIPPIPFPDLKKKPCSQPHIYYRIYGKKYLAHKAEEDAQALLQICAYHGEDFVSWAESNFTAFRTVKPKWNT